MLQSPFKFVDSCTKNESNVSVGKIVTTFFYIGIFCSLFYVDHVLGNGMIDTFVHYFCRCFCFLRSKFIEEARKSPPLDEPPTPTNFKVFFAEAGVLAITMMFLQKYKLCRRSDRLDLLLQESTLVLRQAANFLEKWKERRISKEIEQSYLDEIPSELQPLELEVPILHMAIVDTLYTSRTQSERGSDIGNITDSSLFSVTNLLDPDNRLSLPDVTPEIEYKFDKPKGDIIFDKPADTYIPAPSKRKLWSVTEED